MKTLLILLVVLFLVSCKKSAAPALPAVPTPRAATPAKETAPVDTTSARSVFGENAEVKIISKRQVSFPKIKHPGHEMVVADFEVIFIDQKTGAKHQEVFSDIVSSFPSGPVPLFWPDRIMKVGQMYYHTHKRR